MKPTKTPSVTILYKDASVVVVVKPQGMPSQPDLTGAPDVQTVVAADGTLFPVHRLDRMTGGVMVFARTRAAAAALSSQFSDHGDEEIGKQYLAVVSGNVEEPLSYHDYLIRDARAGMARVVSHGAGGQEARLYAFPVAHAVFAGRDITLLEVHLKTGRFHQIRCQLSTHGYPILGDGKYGSRVRMPLALFAEVLTFRHPETGETLAFRTSAPAGGAWDLFSAVLAHRSPKDAPA